MATVPTRAALDRRLTELEARVAALEVGEPQPVTLTVTIEPAVHDDAAVGTVVATCVTDADALRLAGADAAMVGFGDDPLQIVTTASLAGVTALDFTVIGTAAGKTAATVDVTIDVEEAPFQIPQDMDRDIDTGRFVGIGVHMQGMDRPIPEMARVRRLLPGVDAMRIGFSTAEIDADGRFTDPEIERAILEWVELGGTWLPVHAAPSNDVIPADVLSAGPAALRTYIADVVLAEVTESWRRFAVWYARQTPEAQRGVCALEVFNEPNAYRRCADADSTAPQGAWQHLFADHQIAVARQMAEWWHGPILTALWAYNAQHEPLLIENAAGETPKGRMEAALGRRLVWSWHFYSDWVRGVTDLEAYWAGRQGVLDFAASARMIMTETNAGDFRPEADEGQAYLWTRLLHRLLDAGVGVVWFSGFNYGSALFWGHGVTLRNPDRLATVLDAAALAAPDLTYDYSDDTTEVRRSTADPRGGTATGVHIRIAGPGNDRFAAGDRATFYFGGTTKIWMEVFAGQLHRLRRVLSSQTGQMDLMADAMDAPLWVAETGDRPPSYYADEFAVTSYIGYGLGSNDHAQELVDLVNSQGEAAAMDRAFALLQAEVDGLPARFNEYRQAIEQRGLKMVMYEGGSHAAPVLGWTNNATLVALLAKVARDARMGLLYTQMLDAWKAAGGQTVCLYTDVEKGTKDGSWGHLERLSDSTPRWAAAMDWNAANPGWWETRAPGTFLGRAAA